MARATDTLDVVVETITPEQALEYLTANVHNRTVRTKRVSKYANEMRNGQWRLTGEAIKFDRTGRLVDGQHRLLAVLESEVTTEFLVVRGVDEDAFDVLDNGLTRNYGDVLKANGFTDVNVLAASARIVLGYEHDALSNADVMTNIANKQAVVKELSRDERYDRYVTGARLGHRANRFGGNSTATAGFYVLATEHWSEELVETFLERVITGVGLEAGSPALALRNWWANGRASKNTEHLAGMIRAWNAHVTGSDLRIVRSHVPGQPFPRIVKGA